LELTAQRVMENRKSIFETIVFKILLAITVGAVVYILSMLVLDILFTYDDELILWHRLIPNVLVGLILVLTEKNISIKRVIFVASGVSVLYAISSFIFF
jgi:hypothetical protein